MKNGIPLRTSKILVDVAGGKVTIKLNVFTSSP